jgi:small subunit ribosomal protein S5
MSNTKIINPSELELNEEVVIKINRVTKVVTGGRRFRFNAIVAVGDGKGHVGIGFGKANEVISAINKAKDNAKKNIFKAPIINGTIPHSLNVEFGGAKVLLRPASPGTGIIAGGPVRAVLEQVGVTDILSKNVGSTNSVNVVRAVEKGLKELRDPVAVARIRGISVKELFS